MTSASTIVKLIDNGMYLSAIRNLSRERKRDPEIGLPVAAAFLENLMWFEAVKILRFHKDSKLWEEADAARAEAYSLMDDMFTTYSDKHPEYLVAQGTINAIVEKFPTIQAPAIFFSDEDKDPILHWASARMELCLMVASNEEFPYRLRAYDSLTQETWVENVRYIDDFGEATSAWFLRLIYD